MEKRSLIVSLLFGLVFYLFAITLYWLTKEWVLLFNFMYIGTISSVGLILYGYLPNQKKDYARNFVQFFIGMYMVIVVAFLWRENIQIESFFINILMLLGGNLGVLFTASILHYFVAKTIGVTLMGRHWCGWACWYPALFDLFPFKKSVGRIKKLEYLPYINLAISLSLSLLLVSDSHLMELYSTQIVMFMSCSIGLYYLIGLVFTLIFKDNRALCKYFCPVPIVQKIFMPKSIFYIKTNKEKCVECKLCNRSCGMDIKVNEYAKCGENVTSKDCIMCRKCIKSCRYDALSVEVGRKRGRTKEYINYKK